jgi:hypothetical protein
MRRLPRPDWLFLALVAMGILAMLVCDDADLSLWLRAAVELTG